MISAEYKQLRALALRPAIGFVGILAWFSMQNAVTGGIYSKFTRDAVGTYVTLTLLALIVWGYASSLKDFRKMSFNPGSAEGRYLASSKTFAFVMNIIVLAMIFLGGFTVFASSIFGMDNNTDFIERLVLMYLPIVIDAAIVFYGVYFGLISHREER